MKVKEFLLSHPEDRDMPLILISDLGIVKKYKSCGSYIDSVNIQLSPEYLHGAVQLDLNEKDSFVMIFCKYIEEDSVHFTS